MTNNSHASNSGVVVSVRGGVVDMLFDAQLPPIYSLLRAGAEKQIVICGFEALVEPRQPQGRK